MPYIFVISRKAGALKEKLVFKVIILGTNIELQAGYLNRGAAVNLSYHLYSALGLGLGVARLKHHDDTEVVMQLWALPSLERFRGLTASFMRGHRAAVVVMRPDEIDALNRMLSKLPKQTRNALLIIVIGSVREAEQIADHTSHLLDRKLEVQSAESVSDTLSILAQGVLPQGEEEILLPRVIAISDDSCPEYRPAAAGFILTPNSPDEVEAIKNMATSLGLDVREDICYIPIPEGNIKIDLYSGSVSLEPMVCGFCINNCKRSANICIVGTDTGWSSERMGNRALLTMAKIYALARRKLPMHVERQFARAIQCDKMVQDSEVHKEDIVREVTSMRIQLFGRRRPNLLDEARMRLNEGRLAASAYDTLQRVLRKIRSTKD